MNPIVGTADKWTRFYTLSLGPPPRIAPWALQEKGDEDDRFSISCCGLWRLRVRDGFGVIDVDY